MKQAIEEFINKMKDGQVESNDLKKRFLTILFYPFMSVRLLPIIFLMSVKYFFGSILLALCLFGVRAETETFFLSKTIFQGLLSLSITLLMLGVYLMFRGLDLLLNKTSEISFK